MANLGAEAEAPNLERGELTIVLTIFDCPAGTECLGDAMHGSFTVFPPNVESPWDVPVGHQSLAVMMPISTILEALYAESVRAVENALWLLAERAFSDTFLEILFRRLWDCLETDGIAERNFADGVLISILSHLLLKTGGSNVPTPTVMPLWRLRKVEEYVDSRLGETIDLDELAAIAGVGRRHFGRSFRQQTGETPHRWIMLRRTQRAKEMIDDTDTPLCEVALMCGFASQSHLTIAFKKLLGTTPNRRRQNARALNDTTEMLLLPRAG
ncbi:hypothetical protein L905_07115 [Agrobacterium sp. TS43]|uniref:helix-turn-helix domain-containing protein n=1 Tax=Agrobacterium TaxID=357 RepID=UPI00036D8F88|nr:MULTISPECIES: AraC family transcriptional regulator [Agrobacterium]EPR21260.1 hypothetical protein L902_01960 [Agrobacterium radiobacter DSM 30147]KDR88548.1 hypothetical protein K538_15725 [Agrobacterium tumefaciens GW4]KVK49918.1 hypothetical protein L903_18770 [Agrobacterium sp. JL28]KVK50210.1 hypothetical protein L904_18770 [Agrobacterium sp. LY4]KVK54253.1 hypothetical protein L901_17950 [Agrobacterium sp. D14]